MNYIYCALPLQTTEMCPSDTPQTFVYFVRSERRHVDFVLQPRSHGLGSSSS